MLDLTKPSSVQARTSMDKVDRSYNPRGVILALLLVSLKVLPPSLALADQRDGRLDDLFVRLQVTQDPADVDVIQRQIWQIWIEVDEPLVRQRMRHGVRAMAKRRYKSALVSFDHAIEIAPEFAEAWNKRATVHILMGNSRASMADLYQTLQLEPRHFGAWSALAVLYNAAGVTPAAIRSLEVALRINPHMRRAKALLDQLRGHLYRPEF